jgi:hypothetical protein
MDGSRQRYFDRAFYFTGKGSDHELHYGLTVKCAESFQRLDFRIFHLKKDSSLGHLNSILDS